MAENLISIHENYTNHFLKIGLPLLEKQGFKLNFNGIKNTDNSTSIILFRNGLFYMISFSTHHLDYADGVIVYESKIKKWFTKPILPIVHSNENNYSYEGDNLDEEILRLTNDLIEIVK